MSSSFDNVVNLLSVHADLIGLTIKSSHQDVENLRNSIGSLNTSITNVGTQIDTLNRNVQTLTESSRNIERLTLVLTILAVGTIFVGLVNLLAILKSPGNLYNLYGITYFGATLILLFFVYYIWRVFRLPVIQMV